MAGENGSTGIRKLTPKGIEALRPREKDYELGHGDTGLRLRVTTSGAKIFRWYVNGAKPRTVITLGRWSMSPQPGHLTLSRAAWWKDQLLEARKGGTLETELLRLRDETRPAPEPSATPAADAVTVNSVADAFLRNVIDKRRKRPEEARHIIERDILSVIGPLPLSELRKVHCRQVVERVVGRGAETYAGKVLQLLKQLLDYAENVEEDFVNPAARLKAANLGVVKNRRQRVLADEELVTFWRALDVEAPVAKVERPDPRTGKVQRYEQRVPAISAATRLALRALLLTGVRSCELLLAKWADLDLEAATWTIPVANQKLTLKAAQTARPFVIPLSPTAADVFRELQDLAGDSPWVLASGEADGGHYTEKALGRALRRLQQGKHPALALPGGLVSPHDLRRTMRTGLARLGVSRDVAERCLNHSLGVIEDTYNRHDYFAERRGALEKWDAFVQRLLAPERATVAFLPGAAAVAP